MTAPRYDPTKTGVFPKNAPRTFQGRQSRECESCERQTPHDLYEAMIGTRWVGLSLPFGRKKTTGKVGTKSHWAFCAECGRGTPLDDAARKVLE